MLTTLAYSLNVDSSKLSMFSIQNFENTVNSQYDQPVLQILVDVFGENGALGIFSLIMSESKYRDRRNIVEY